MNSKSQNSKEYFSILITRTIGNFLILSSLLMIGKTFGPALYQEAMYAYKHMRGTKTTVVIANNKNAGIKIKKTKNNSPVQASNVFSRIITKIQSTEEVITPVDTEFSIVIPKLSANSRVIKNVNPADYNEYITALKKGVAHAKGTAFPGDKGHIYLFAHSTDSLLNVGTYNAVFYLLYKLEKNDIVYLFYKGKKYAYKVMDKKTIEPTDVKYITRSSPKELLTLQTCWPPGTTLKRLLVFAVPVVE